MMSLFARLPFDYKTPLGFACVFMIESVSTYAVAYSILPSLCFALGSFLLVGAGVQDISSDFQLLCERASDGNECELKQLLSNLVEHIAEMKQLRDLTEFAHVLLFHNRIVIILRLVVTFTDFNQFNISALFMWSILTIRGAILIIHLELVEYLDRKISSNQLPRIIYTLVSLL